MPCKQCDGPLPPLRKKFCCHKCAQTWHNARQVWAERPDRELHNARKKANPDAQAARLRAWRARNPEAQKAIERRNRTRNAEKIREQAKQWREQNREHLQERSLLFHQKTRELTPWKHILRSRFRDALRRNIPFALTPEWAAARWTGRCEITNIPFDLSRNVVGFYSPSIDKIDANKGYMPDNCRFVLFSVNAFKNSGTDHDMLLAAEAIVYSLKRGPGEVISPEA